jgi:hypothetical protein
MIINLTNPLQKLALGVASALATFSTDSTPPVQTTANVGAGNGYMTCATTAGILAGDILALEGANTGGNGPWVSVVLGSITATNINVSVPGARTSVTGAVLNRLERIETRYRAKKVVLTNNTTGDVFMWDTTLRDNQAYKTSGGVTTTISNGISNRSNCIGIHPNLLPVNCSFTLQCDYDYHG